MKRICLLESHVIHEGKEILKGHIFFEKVKKKNLKTLEKDSWFLIVSLGHC